jgi:hypothetical protein
MAISIAALELEKENVGARGAPTLGRAYELLRDQWLSGERDRELALHLVFLAWYLMVEPPHLTGLDENRVPTVGLCAMFIGVHDWLLPHGSETNDAEALFVIGLMARLGPWLFGDEAAWTGRSEVYRARYRQLAPQGIDPAVFCDRGAYGEYFGRQARVRGGD